MPAFGDHASSALLPGDEVALQRHRQQQYSRNAFKRPAATERDSRRLEVYIYNVGPFARKMDTLGSEGVHIIPGLPEKDALKGLAVAGPDIIPGLPAEQVNGEPRGLWLEHANTITPDSKWMDADGEVFLLQDRPGIDLGLRIIGAHADSIKNPYAASAWQQGCFVSTIREQKAEPKAPREPDAKASASAQREYGRLVVAYEEEMRLWIKWESSVKAAHERFTVWAMQRGEEQALAYSNGNYTRDEQTFVLARIFGKTTKDWNFLAGTSANATQKHCHYCGSFMMADKPKCPVCREWQPGMKPSDRGTESA